MPTSTLHELRPDLPCIVEEKALRVHREDGDSIWQQKTHKHFPNIK